MKNSLVKALAGIGFIAMVVFATMAFTDIEDPKYSYCEIVSTQKVMSSKLAISVYFGKSPNSMISEEDRTKILTDVPKLKTVIDASNYMGERGWEVQQIYHTSKGLNVEHWLLRKRIQ